jgi:hypothetical protein
MQLFEAFMADDLNSGPVLLGNLKAEQGLGELVGTIQNQVFDLESATSLQDMTWCQMRTNLFWLCGATDSDTFATNIDFRLHELSDITVVLKLLESAEAALVKEAAQQAATANAALTNSGFIWNANKHAWLPATNLISANTTNLLSLIQLIGAVVIDSGRQVATNDAVLTNASILQRTIIKTVAASRDPASAYALVAAIGTGLDATSITLLTQFLATLQASATNTNQITLSLTVGQTKPTSLIGFLNDPRFTELYNAHSDFHAAVCQFINVFGPSRSIPGRATPESIISDLSLFAASTRSSRAATKRVVEQLDKTVTSMNVDYRAPLVRPTNQKKSGTLLPPSASSPIPPSPLQGFGSYANYGNFIISALTAGIPGASKVLSDTNLINPRDLSYLAGIVGDVQTEQQTARARYLQFFYNLSQLQVQVFAEDQRHYQAFETITYNEIVRWTNIFNVYRRYEGIYNGGYTNGPPAYLQQVALFKSKRDATAQWNSGVTNLPAFNGYSDAEGSYPLLGGVTSSNLLSPTILTNALILPSIRLLAENAYSWQVAAPGTIDPLGYYTRASNFRLMQAVHFANAHLLMGTMNQHLAQENGLQLQIELKEHDLLLDGLLRQVQESLIDLELLDLAAFHGTGWTPDDIRTIASVVQSGLVAWIGFNTK